MPTIFYRSPPPAKPKPGPTVMTVKTHQPWRCSGLLAIVIIILGGGGLWLCQHSLQVVGQGKQNFIEQQIRAQEAQRQQVKILEQDHASLTVQNKELREKLAALIHTTQTSQTTYAQVLQSLTQAQQDVQDLTEELQLYKKLFDSKTSSRSGNEVSINSFSINRDETNGYYQYRLVLIQFTKVAKPIQGQWQIEILGQHNGVEQQLNMNQLTLDNRYSQPYQVQRFQKWVGYLQFPTDFNPKQVIIRLIPARSTKTATEVRFQWADLLNKES